MKRLLFALVFVSILYSLSGQNIKQWAKSKESVLYEKVYLHIDRELYSTGDTIWFKSYLVSGMTNKLITGYKNIYVQLVSPNGEVVSNSLLLSVKGESKGDITIPDSLHDGQYVLRAYTKYLENFGEESFFHKRIWISEPKSSLELDQPEVETKRDLDVMFFPEGGNLILNAVNHVAFKAVNKNGKGIDIKGEVVDEQGNLVTSFHTDFMGMGRFVFMPNEGKTYYAKINGHPDFQFQFENILDNGFTINFSDEGTEVLISIIRNIKRNDQQKAYFAAMHKGVVLFHKELEISNFNEVVKLQKNLFPLGISKISLLDLDFNIIAERLVFISDGILNSMEIGLNKEEFSTREQVKISINSQLELTDTVQGAFSVSVVNENYLGSSGNSLSLKSYLLVDSELKGIVESPARYFINEDGLTSEKKLDLLMMVQGWRSYYWDDIIENAPDNMEGWADAGLIVEGNVKRLLRDKPVVGGEVVIGPFSRNFLFEETRTDNNGRFKFDRLYLKDNSVVMLNAKNERDRANTEIILDPLYSQDTVVSIDSINKTLGNIDIPMMFYRQSYFRQMAKNEFMPDEGTIMIGDVDVIGYKPQFEDDGHYRLHNEPDNSLIVTQDDYIGYSNILEYLTGRVPGLDVSGETISIRGGGQPLFLLDGVVASGSMVLETPMQDIDKIEVLKSGYATSFYGSQGGNGVIAIFTRHGDNQAEIERYIKGRIELQVNGFQQANRFYSPRYSLKNINNEEPDYRPTLYWSPEVKMNENHAEVEFFTCDELANYLVLVEGISKNGKIFSGIKKFNVTEKISKTEGIEKLAPQTDSVLYEKVYLHIDRELYSPGDTLWFKSYLTGGITNKLHKGYKNIYVQFVSPLGEVISNRLLLSQNGEAHGDFALNDSLPDGQYTVRAYTKYLENFGEESFFHKRIWISAPKSSLELELPTEKKPSLVDAMFFPEGGNLLANTFNNISFKVIGQDGRGVEASGKVINKKGDIIASFKSSFLGMGRFTFKPLGGEEYYATIDNHPEVKYKFERIKDKGLTLNFREEEKNALFNISGNYDTGNQKDLFVVATHKGIVLFYEDISMNGPTHTTVFDKKDFPLGISKVSLYDDTFNIISERLIFIDHNKGNSVAIELDKEEFLLREEVNLNLEPILSPGDSVTSALSVSVVSEDYLSSVGNNQNIKSYLLIDSELKGVIESPALYFFDEEKITSAEKLDLLMMVQGWRSYYWDDIAKIASSNLFGWVDVGLSVGGYVKELFNKNRVAGGEVRLGPYSPQLLFEETTTDNYGRFMFENLYLPDSTEVMVFATNEKGKNSVEVIMNQPVQFESVIDTGLINGSLGKINIPMLYYREIYMQQMAERAFIPDSGSIMIGEVEVVAITNEDVYELTKPFYDFYPTKSFIITEEDYKYQSIYDFLLLKVDSRYLDEVVADEGADDEGEPMIVVYLDGRKLDANEIPSLENYSMEDIYRIDYRRKQLKNAFEPDGVPETFYFYRNRILKGFKPAIWGNTVFQVNGFQQPNEFYSPKYTLESINDKMPDYRPTLYWSPEVVVKNGKANIEFFTCDNLSNYVVIVEGISKNGKICYGVERFSVTRLNED